MATNRSSQEPPLLSLEVEPATHGSLTLTAAALSPSAAIPRLRVRNVGNGVLTVSLRSAADGAGGRPGAFEASGGGAALGQVWAWPLPQEPMSAWQGYEDMLRGLVAAGGVNVRRAAASGVPLTLRRSMLRGVSLVSFDMHVRAPLDMSAALGLQPGGWPFEPEQSVNFLYEVVMEIQDAEAAHAATGAVSRGGRGSGKGRAGRFRYVPVSVVRRRAWGPTWTVGDGALDALDPFRAMTSARNATLPLGYEDMDLGVARAWQPSRGPN